MNSKGFTLIELVVVIVILGILAVTAVPKYIHLQADAQTSTLEGVKVSIQGASALAYSRSLVAGNQKLSTASVTLSDGTEIDVQYGYPTTNLLDWQEVLDLDSSDFEMAISNSVLIIYPVSLGVISSQSADCIVTYQPATAMGVKPIITVNSCV
ncbi:type II secretion system protein [Candidatus Colwellia aromaticivorans]|uniref:type II secretion system protein n=1 Tax=Candidatus Colwellia aromaticivorans TaxID=2267621 RepID=UPI000DF28827|nr:prepilin-type N-terminal cleavage/methylation domain-containing protein [Candidatus Colwellia aromaticivorans]